MATWQFDIHLLPKAGALKHAQGDHIRIDEVDSEEWWRGTDKSALRIDLSELLSSAPSWHDDIERWGTEDGDRIELMSDGLLIVDVFIRIDVREISYKFLVQLLEFFRRNSLLLIAEGGAILEPRISDLIAAIRWSTSFRFVSNPTEFLQRLEDELKK